MFEKLKNLIKNNKGFLIKTTILLGMYFFLSDFAFAQNAGSVTPGNGTEEEIKNKIVSVLVTLSTTLSVLLGLLTYLVTMFLSPEWITGNIFDIGDKLKAIWILISNVVYFAFAFILIYIAFMNIVGAGGNDYEFKSALPKFIVGILIVPFSWFLVNFLVTLSSILTIAALNLPYSTFEHYKTGISQVQVPKTCTLNLNALSSTGKTSNNSNSYSNDIFKCGDDKVPFSEVIGTDNSAESIFGMTSLYTYGLVNLEKTFTLDKITLENTVKTLGDTVIKVIFDMVFVIAYSLLMVALGLALMIRGIWLWIYMMLSPLFGLMYFFGKGKDGFFEKFNITEFLHLCMVPVYTMLALSFGMLFIYTTGEGLTLTSKENTVKVENKENESIVINDKFTLNIIGPVSHSDNGEVKNFFEVVGKGALGIVGSLILKLFGIVVLWGTVMMALSKSEITKAMVEPIANFGKSVGDMAKTIPQYTPILPGGTSLNTLQQVPRQIQNNVMDVDATRRQKLFGEWGLTNEFQELNANLEKTMRKIAPNGQLNGSLQEAIKAGSFSDMRGNINEKTLGHSETRDNYQKLLGIHGLKVDLSKVKTEEQFYNEIQKAIFASNKKDQILQGMGGIQNTSEQLKQFFASTGSVLPTNIAQTGSNITINLANKSINLGNDKTINFSENAKDINTISSEIKTGLGNSNISKTDLKKALDNVGIKDNETINSIIAQLGDKVTE